MIRIEGKMGSKTLKNRWKDYIRQAHIEQAKYIVFDIEASGGNPQKNGLTEVCALKVHDGEIVDQFYTLVNPEVRIPPIVRRMTGINQKMVQNAPLAKEIMPKFMEFIDEHILVSHNTQGDLKFLNHFAKVHCNQDIENFFICTHLLSEKLTPQAKDKSLTGMAKHFNISVDDDHHRADVDAHLTLELFRRLRSILIEQDVTTVEGAVRVQQDLESGIRMGWQVPKEQLREAPRGCGVIRFFDQHDDLIFILSSQFMQQDIKKISNLRSLPRRVARELLKSHRVAFESRGNLLEAYQIEVAEETRFKLGARGDSLHGRVASTINFDKEEAGTRIYLGVPTAKTAHAFGKITDKKQAQAAIKGWITDFAVKSKRKGFVLPGIEPDFLGQMVAEGADSSIKQIEKSTWKTMISSRARNSQDCKKSYVSSLRGQHGSVDKVVSSFGRQYRDFFSIHGLIIANHASYEGKAIYPVAFGKVILEAKMTTDSGDVEEILQDKNLLKEILQGLRLAKKNKSAHVSQTSKSDHWLLDGCLPDQFFYGCRFFLEQTIANILTRD